MKKYSSGILPLLVISLLLSGCVKDGDNTMNYSIVYIAAALLSAVLLISYCLLASKKTKWFIILFSSVFVINTGYSLLSVSTSLETALWANRLSYLGSVFLPFSMMMIILNTTCTKYKRALPSCLLTLGALMFFIASSPGILDIYYKDVSFQIVNGVGTLIKVYGILHPIYLVYLVGYFSAMVAIIIRAKINKSIDTTSHAAVLALAVLVNIGVWGIEQVVDFNFEFLSISYIISESFLLGIHMVTSENQRLRQMITEQEIKSVDCSSQRIIEHNISSDSQNEKNVSPPHKNIQNDIPRDTNTETYPYASNAEVRSFASNAEAHSSYHLSNLSTEQLIMFAEGLKILTPTEKAIYESYISGKTTKEIMSELNIKENTLKFHNKNLYGKLGVSSRKQLVEIYKTVKSDMTANKDKATVTIEEIQ